MNAMELIQNLTGLQLKGFVSDFNYLMEQARKLHVEGKPITTILPYPKYRSVLRVINGARIASVNDNEAYRHFCDGIAAAIYGLMRLHEAGELQEQLEPRLNGCRPQPDDVTNQEKQEAERVETGNDQKVFTFDDLCAFFDLDDIKYCADQSKGIVMFGLTEKIGPIHVAAQIRKNANVLRLLFTLPLTVPKERRTEISLAITQLNYGLLIGRYEMDLNDGELNYKIVMPIDNAVVSHEQLYHCMFAATTTIERYLPALHRVVFEEISGEEAIKAVETDVDPPL